MDPILGQTHRARGYLGSIWVGSCFFCLMSWCISSWILVPPTSYMNRSYCIEIEPFTCRCLTCSSGWVWWWCFPKYAVIWLSSICVQSLDFFMLSSIFRFFSCWETVVSIRDSRIATVIRRFGVVEGPWSHLWWWVVFFAFLNMGWSTPLSCSWWFISCLYTWMITRERFDDPAMTRVLRTHFVTWGIALPPISISSMSNASFVCF